MDRFEILKNSDDVIPCFSTFDDERPISEPGPRPGSAVSELVLQYMESGEGRSRLAESMMAPLRQRRDYSSIARRAFRVESIPEGALPLYDRG